MVTQTDVAEEIGCGCEDPKLALHPLRLLAMARHSPYHLGRQHGHVVQ